ncbi:MAG: hypothetical protein FD166_1118 [Bacteroidetes bacterium]|nr:MAG: hypothetical protein FD166_1118 [Bacteroidota bacterium]
MINVNDWYSDRKLFEYAHKNSENYLHRTPRIYKVNILRILTFKTPGYDFKDWIKRR